MRVVFLVVLMALSSFAWAGQHAAGGEVAGEAFVSWEAVIKKISTSQSGEQRIKATIEFHGHTLETKQIWGAGDLRFVSDGQRIFEPMDVLTGNNLLRYWATVKTVMGGGLAIVKGTAVLAFSTSDSLNKNEGVIDLKAVVSTD